MTARIVVGSRARLDLSSLPADRGILYEVDVRSLISYRNPVHDQERALGILRPSAPPETIEICVTTATASCRCRAAPRYTILFV